MSRITPVSVTLLPDTGAANPTDALACACSVLPLSAIANVSVRIGSLNTAPRTVRPLPPTALERRSSQFEAVMPQA